MRQNSNGTKAVMSDTEDIEDRYAHCIRMRQPLEAAEVLADDCRQRDAEIERLYKNITGLMKAIGNPGSCQGCGSFIWWVKTKNDKNMPVTRDGLIHFANCPLGDQFSRGARNKKK